MTAPARCPVCGGQLPARDRPHGGRRPRYCSGACKAKAYRTRQQAGEPVTEPEPLPPGARHARAVEIRQQVSELAGILADTASGQQALFATPGTARRARPAETARTLHRLIAELTTLAATATVTKRATKRRAPADAPQAPPLFDDPDHSERRHPGSWEMPSTEVVAVSVAVKNAPRGLPPGRFGCSDGVVRDRIELSTFRFSEGLLPLEPPWITNRARPSCLHIG